MSLATQQDVADAIYSRLSGDSGAGGVSTLCGTRIYEGEAKQNAALPLIRWNVVTDPDDSYFGSAADFDIEFQIDVFGDRRAGVKVTRTIAAACVTLLDQQNITVTNATGGKTRMISRGRPEPDEDSYHITLRFQLTATIA